MGKKKRVFSEETKRQAVDEYVSGRKSVAQIAAGLEIGANMVYRWRVQLEEQKNDQHLDEIAEENKLDPRRADRRIRELERELDEYKKKLAGETVIVDLLKKRLRSKSFPERSELTGLIETLERAAQKRRRGES